MAKGHWSIYTCPNLSFSRVSVLTKIKARFLLKFLITQGFLQHLVWIFGSNLFTYSINERSRSYLEKGKEMSHAPHYWTIIEIGTFETFWNCNSFLFCLRICWFLKGCMQWTGWWWWNHTAMTKSPRLTGLEASWARARCRWQMKQSTTVVVGSNFQLLTSCSISKISIGSSE